MKPVTRIPYLGGDMRTKEVVHVVIVYLFGAIAGVQHVLLMRRGSHVAYMKNAWSSIAGVSSEDCDHQRRALIEIAGETTLLQSEVRPPRYVSAFADQDTENKKTWFRHILVTSIIKDAKESGDLGVQLDWEHKEAAWVPVEIIVKWLDGQAPEDPVARAILMDEPHTPDFELNLSRIRHVLDQFVK